MLRPGMRVVMITCIESMWWYFISLGHEVGFAEECLGLAFDASGVFGLECFPLLFSSRDPLLECILLWWASGALVGQIAKELFSLLVFDQLF